MQNKAKSGTLLASCLPPCYASVLVDSIGHPYMPSIFRGPSPPRQKQISQCPPPSVYIHCDWCRLHWTPLEAAQMQAPHYQGVHPKGTREPPFSLRPQPPPFNLPGFCAFLFSCLYPVCIVQAALDTLGGSPNASPPLPGSPPQGHWGGLPLLPVCIRSLWVHAIHLEQTASQVCKQVHMLLALCPCYVFVPMLHLCAYAMSLPIPHEAHVSLSSTCHPEQMEQTS